MTSLLQSVLVWLAHVAGFFVVLRLVTGTIAPPFAANTVALVFAFIGGWAAWATNTYSARPAPPAPLANRVLGWWTFWTVLGWIALGLRGNFSFDDHALTALIALWPFTFLSIVLANFRRSRGQHALTFNQ